MKIELLPESGNFYKVNMHCHTNLSDGAQTPEEVKVTYQKLGYSAVCFTDHEVLLDQRALCDESFVALHGYEVAIKKYLNASTGIFMPVYHFNLIAKDQSDLNMVRFFKNNPSSPGNARKWIDECAQYSDTIETTRYEIDWINDYLKAVTEAGFLVNYNHPMWSLQNAFDYLGLEHIHSIEVINGGCQPFNDNTSIHFEQMLRTGKRVVPTAGDDNHKAWETGLAWTMIKAPKLTYDALIKAYEKGDCYVSEGPEIHSLVLEDGKIKVKTSPAASISLFSQGRHVQLKRSRTETYTEAEFNYLPEKFGAYFRIEVRDAAGYRAFSNAYYTDEIKNT